MALATWITLLVATQRIDEERRSHPKAAQRSRRKYSLFSLGLRCLHTLIGTEQHMDLLWQLVVEPDPDDIRDLMALLLPNVSTACNLQDVNVLNYPVRP